MTELPKELREQMILACTELKITTPSVKVTHRRYGCYRPTQQLINLGQINLKNPDMLKQVFVHELAHHVDRMTNTDRNGRRSHDRKFYSCLLWCIDRFYGDRSAYPWRWEYRSIMSWARSAGYTKATPVSKRSELVTMAKLQASVDSFFPIPASRVAAERGQL